MRFFQHNLYSLSRLSPIFLMIAQVSVASKESESCLNILLTNDDGYETLLTNSLFEFLRDETCHNVKLVAPKGAQSGKGGAIEIFTPNLEEGNPKTDVYFLDSTPVTTVLYGLDIVCGEADFEPDLIIAGPNEGWNQGWAAQISGTVNGAVAALARGYPAIAVSASPVGVESEDSAGMVAKIVINLIETKLLQDGELILGQGEGLTVNIPTISNVEAEVNDYTYKLTKIGRGASFGAVKFYRDLKDANSNQLFFGGAFNGLSGLGFTLPYNGAGIIQDIDPESEYNAFGPVLTDETFVVTVSPLQYSFAADPSLNVLRTFDGDGKTTKSNKSAKKGKGTKAPKGHKSSTAPKEEKSSKAPK